MTRTSSARPSTTAQAVAVYRAAELARPPERRIVSDEYAPLFLTAASRVAVGALTAARPVRDLAARHELGGLSTYVLCRHRFVDEHLRLALSAGAEQVLILGAGYDSRAYRFAEPLAGRPVFEVDLPPLSRRKAAVVAAHPDRFGHASVRRVEIDFRTQSLAERLDATGFSRGARTFVVWEGVAPYLDAPAVDTTLDAIRAVCGPGSEVAVDLWDRTGGPGPLAGLRRLGARAIALVGEPVTFGMPPAEAPALLGAHGLEVTDLAVAPELTARYATDGRRCIESIYVLTAGLA